MATTGSKQVPDEAKRAKQEKVGGPSRRKRWGTAESRERERERERERQREREREREEKGRCEFSHPAFIYS